MGWGGVCHPNLPYDRGQSWRSWRHICAREAGRHGRCASGWWRPRFSSASVDHIWGAV